MLEPNVPRAVVDRLNSTKVKKSRVVCGSRKTTGLGLPVHGADGMLQGWHHRGVARYFARIHEVARLNFYFVRIDAADGIAHLLERSFRIVAGKQPAVEHDPAFALDRVRRLGKAFNRIGRQTRLAEVAMSFSLGIGH